VNTQTNVEHPRRRPRRLSSVCPGCRIRFPASSEGEAEAMKNYGCAMCRSLGVVEEDLRPFIQAEGVH